MKKIKAIFPLIILALADAAVMAIPLYMENFIPNIYNNLLINSGDYSQAVAIYGYCALPCYIFGAYIGDKFKSRNLIIISLIIISCLALWYITVPFVGAFNLQKFGAAYATKLVKWQLYVIFGGFAFATCGLFWAPLWKLVKNFDTENLVGMAKEKKVGKNNGIEGSFNGLIGLTIALLGTALFFLTSKNLIPYIKIYDTAINLGFIILVCLYTSLIILSVVLTMKYVKEPNQEEISFSFHSLFDVMKKWRVWFLGLLVLGVYMLQMGLGSYVNYLTNIFQVAPIVVMIIGIFRAYVMRFMISPFAGKKADHSHSYIFWICVGLLIGIVLVLIGVLLPGFKNDLMNQAVANPNSARIIILQVAACLNLILLGALTWAIVTIRWSPLGTELKLPNNQYGTGVSFISCIAFTPDAFFRQIRSALENKYYYINNEGNKAANQLGNQLILVVVLAFAFMGLIAGVVLYFSIYKPKKGQLFAFKKRTQPNIIPNMTDVAITN